MSVKLLTEHHLEFLSLKGDFTGSSESTLVKIPYFWKSHVAALFFSSTHSYWVAWIYVFIDPRYGKNVMFLSKTMMVRLV